MPTANPKTRSCSIEGCDRPHQAKGLCFMHYQRKRRTGDVGSAEPRITASSERGRRDEHRHTQNLMAIRAHAGDKFLRGTDPDNRRLCRLGSRKGRVSLHNNSFMALSRRGWVFKTGRVSDFASYEVTPAGINACPTPPTMNFEFLKGVHVGSEPPSGTPALGHFYFAMGYIAGTAHQDVEGEDGEVTQRSVPLTDHGYLGTLMVRDHHGFKPSYVLRQLSDGESFVWREATADLLSDEPSSGDLGLGDVDAKEVEVLDLAGAYMGARGLVGEPEAEDAEEVVLEDEQPGEADGDTEAPAETEEETEEETAPPAAE